MRILTSLGAVLALGVALASPAAAAPLGSFTHNYGTGAYDPSGSDALSTGYVTVSDQSSVRFSDSFNFASLQPGNSIDSLALTLTFSAAGPDGISFACGAVSFNVSECWQLRAQGANSSTQSDDYFATLFSNLSPQTFTLSAATDTGGVNAFATSLSTGTFAFWFAEQTGNFLHTDKFNLSSAKLEVFGTPAAVPLPAGGLLLLGALGGLAALRRKRAA